jgi:hypothetical protein
MTRTMIATCFIFCMVGCKQSVVVNHPQSNETLTRPFTIDVTFDTRADTSTFKAAIDWTDITQTFIPTPTPGGNSTSSNPLPSSLPSGSHSLSVYAEMHGDRLGDVLGHSTDFRIAQPATPPNPAISLTVSPTDVAGAWGTNMSATVTVESKNGFAGNVDLVVSNAPFGVTPQFASATLLLPANGSVSSSMTLQTVEAATALGEQRIAIRAVPQAGTPAPQNRQLMLRIDRTSGAFTHVSGGNCQNISAVVVPIGTGPAVKFTDSNTTLNATAIPLDPASGYAIATPSCRSAVAVPPPTIPPTPPGSSQSVYTTDLVNLGFPPGIGLSIPSRGELHGIL